MPNAEVVPYNEAGGGLSIYAPNGLSLVTQAIAGNFSGQKVRAFDFDRLKVPTGGETQWAIQTLDGIRNVPAIQAVIISFTDRRVFWQGKFVGGGNPPDCQSSDCLVGNGDPGGNCMSCPMAKFGSKQDGAGQACKQIRHLFLLTEQSLLPLVLTIPPSSLQTCRQYIMRLSGHGAACTDVRTSFSLAPARNKDGIQYAKVNFSVSGRLTPDQQHRIREYASMLNELIKDSVIDADYEAVQE